MSLFLNHLKKKESAVYFIFLIVLLISWCTHLSFRNDHFQDVDSATVYPMMHDFPESALRTTALFYPAGHIFSTSTAENIINQPIVRSMKDKYLSSFTDEFIINQLTKTSLPAAIRYAFIQATASVYLPFPILSFFSVPLTSTYSAGVGFIYGLITGVDTQYETFMSRTLVVTITLFHLTILLLFLINRRLNILDPINAVVCLIALFSISMYSSGLNLGSPIWNSASEYFWIWYLLKHKDSPNIDSQISHLTAILVFFNYLIVFLWVPYVLFRLKQTIDLNPKGFAKATLRDKFLSVNKCIWNICKSQQIAIILIGICSITFFQPGQGFRGNASWAELPTYVYYIILNFTSWYTHNAVADIIQFILTLGLIYSALYFLFKKTSSETVNECDAKNMTQQILLYFFYLYMLAVLFRVLSFIPTRHMLFLTPILFIGGAAGLHSLIRSRIEKVRIYIMMLLIVSLSMLGLTYLQIRRVDTQDLRPTIIISDDISIYGIYDLSHDLYYYLKEQGLATESINPNSFEAEKTYLFISHSEPFEVALRDWQTKFAIQTEVISSQEVVQPIYFMAYNPDFAKLRYGRPNNLYQTKFKVKGVQKKGE